jgi:hypothetical protein
VTDLVRVKRGRHPWVTEAESSGGGSVQRELLNGLEVTIANGAGGDLQWQHVSGDALLDLTDPALPLVVEEGVYAITVEVLPSADMTAGGAYQVSFDMDVNNEDASVTATSPPAVTAILAPATTVGMTYFCAAGAALLVNLGNRDGVQDLNFKIQHAVVQRLS